MGDISNTIATVQIAAFVNNPAQMFPAAIVAIAVGYIYYVYSFRIARREKVSTVPVWLHAFFLADDSTAAVVFYVAARNHDWFWFYILFCSPRAVIADIARSTSAAEIAEIGSAPISGIKYLSSRNRVVSWLRTAR